MPIYEFRCEACGAEFDVLISAETEPKCVECGAGGLTRTYSPQAAPQRLVKSRGEVAKQERANARLREDAKARFKQARANASARKTPRADGKR